MAAMMIFCKPPMAFITCHGTLRLSIIAKAIYGWLDYQRYFTFEVNSMLRIPKDWLRLRENNTSFSRPLYDLYKSNENFYTILAGQYLKDMEFLKNNRKSRISRNNT